MTLRTSLLIVEDHPLYRHGLMDVLNQSQAVDELRTVNSGEAALALLGGGVDFDLILSDWRLPDMDGLALLRLVAKDYPTIARVLMSGTDDPRLPASCIDAGLLGFLPKSLDPKEMVSIISRMLMGDSWFPARSGAQRMLTPRQTQVLEGIAAGQTNKHLARSIGITERTVKHHLTAIFARLGTTRRAEAVSRAVAEGLIRLPQ
jgi:DNA-binding NarL/FixJ family response regulator